MTEWTPPTPHELLVWVRDVIRDNPVRHKQYTFVGNVFTYRVSTMLGGIGIGKVRPYARLPVPRVPEDYAEPLCGTTACVCGWAIIGGEDPEARFTNGGVVSVSGAVTAPWDRGRELLGLSEDQADYLFDGCRSWDEVLEYLDQLIENHDAEPPSSRQSEDDDDWDDEDDE